MSVKLSREWAQKAEEDYQAALFLSHKRKPLFLNAICFHSQQAAEKYLKAYLALKGISFPKTHDLVLLKKFCMEKDADFEFISDLIISLNPYSVEFRYPGEQATRQDMKIALAAVKEIRELIKRKLKF